MKKFFSIVFLLFLLLSACSAKETPATIPEENYTQGVFQLTFTTKLISNDSVGNDWFFTYTCDGQTIKSGHKIIQPLGTTTTQRIGVEVREKDKIDDVGTATFTITLCDGASGKTTVTITESGGRYKNHQAVWEIGWVVKLKSKQ